MWLICHFYLIYLFKPSHTFHILVLPLLFLNVYYTKLSNVSLIQVKSALGLYLMYYGFFVYQSPMEFTFAPWYCVTCMSIRDKDYYVFTGAVFTMIHLYTLASTNIIGHLNMNIGRLIKTHDLHAVMHIIVHLACFLTKQSLSPDFKFNLEEFISAFSAFLCIFFSDNADEFSMAMLFTSSRSYTSFFLHILEFDWYEYYRNNHFLPVYGGSNWIVAIGVALISLLKVY